MEEKTPVGSNAPIEESTEKKTSPAGSNSPSAAPAGSSSASPASIAETADVVDTASTDASTKSADAGAESAPAAPAAGDSASPASIAETADVVDSASADAGAKSAGAEETASADEASAAEAVPDGEEDENAQWEAYEREQAEIEESRRKPGKYRWVMKQDDMREAMLALEKAKGRYRMYTIAAYVMRVFDDRCLCGCGARFLDSRYYQPCCPGRYEADESPGHQVLHRGEKAWPAGQ